jgi:hypothetical protein
MKKKGFFTQMATDLFNGISNDRYLIPNEKCKGIIRLICPTEQEREEWDRRRDPNDFSHNITLMLIGAAINDEL